MSDDRLSANREKIKQRNLKLHEQGRTIEDCDPREMHAQNLDPEVQAEVDALRLTPDERARITEKFTAPAIRDQRRAQENARDDS